MDPYYMTSDERRLMATELLKLALASNNGEMIELLIKNIGAIDRGRWAEEEQLVTEKNAK